MTKIDWIFFTESFLGERHKLLILNTNYFERENIKSEIYLKNKVY